jgi:uncharacterized membrane protein
MDEHVIEIDVIISDIVNGTIVARAIVKLIYGFDMFITLNSVTVFRRKDNRKLFITLPANRVGNIYYQLINCSPRLKIKIEEAIYIKLLDMNVITREDYDGRALN